MFEKILKIEKMERGLEKSPEYWQSDSYDGRLKKTTSKYLKDKGYKPHPNLKMFRELSFMIKASVGISDIRSLARVIKERYAIDCFQISIDRENNIAHMLFDWLDEESNGVVFGEFEYKKLMVLVVRYLNLPRPSCIQPLVKFFLKDAYDLNSEVFKQQLDILYHAKVPGLNYSLIADSILYSESMCKGELK